MTEAGDTNGADGYTPLPEYGDVLHAITVAPNGDVYTAVRTSGGAATAFRSLDRGGSWRSIGHNLPNNTLVRQIVIPPTYPTDPFLALVYANADLRRGAGGLQERTKQTVAKVRPTKPGSRR
ncbi:MAG: hypothetical protein EXR52_00070 [Dehalococcoidia bacterium]|nr:hypothetical protein [Dehalococcoidia bacterium]